MAMQNKLNSTVRKHLFTASDEQLLDELDTLVGNAARGDSDAVGAIAIAFGPSLLAAAREELDPANRKDAGDAFQDLCLCLLESRLRYPGIRGGALPWLKRMIRVLARARNNGHLPDWDHAG